MQLCLASQQEEKVVKLSFSPEERVEYDKVEKAAAEFYNRMKRTTRDINKHYLKINSGLMPLRVACSGGLVDAEEDRTKKVKLPSLPNAFKMDPTNYNTECCKLR